jgi:cytochrome c biogenesis factor
MFLGMYIAFLIAYVCFYIHSDGMDSRFSLSVGALFAVIGNKYIIDSSLPESTSFTLVDTLHGLTLSCILIIVAATAYSLILVKNNQMQKAKKFDMYSAQILLLLYVLTNMYFIVRATQ